MLAMKSVVVCVEYDDLLRVTLSRNHKHFVETIVVTSPADVKTQALVREFPNVTACVTDAFYRNGNKFNKGAALEEGLEATGRKGWIVVWDADIVMPPKMPLAGLTPNCLYNPRRHILDDPSEFSDTLDWNTVPVRPDRWFPGYFQLFHSDDPALRLRPWYGSRWEHAGGCDSDFERKWVLASRKRLPFNVLHLGPCDTNWYGRTTERLDSEAIDEAVLSERKARMGAIRKAWRQGLKTPTALPSVIDPITGLEAVQPPKLPVIRPQTHTPRVVRISKRLRKSP